MSQDRLSHAIVVGGSLAGMLTARVLSHHFSQVTIIERDEYPESPAPRPGIPQSRHLHGLLLRGTRILEDIFPGISAELLESGALKLDAGDDLKWLMPRGWGVRYSSGMTVLSFTRDLLDYVVRKHVNRWPNITILSGYEAVGLLTNLFNDRVRGVRIRDRHAEKDVKNIEADFVVVASGRNSKLNEWLADLGYDAAEESYVNAHVGYASRLYSIPAAWEADWKAVILQAAPPERVRGGLMLPVEGNRWLVTAVGGDRDYPPVDEGGFLSFIESLPSREIIDAISHAKPLTAISGYRTMENRIRHFEKMKKWPRRLVTLGDGVCAFNPVYAQGMTMAAIGAELLSDMIASRGIDDLGLEYQKRLAKANNAPWMLATGTDFRYRTTEGIKPGPASEFMHWYMDKIFQLVTHDSIVRTRFFEVHQMTKPASALFAPQIVWRVVKTALSGGEKVVGEKKVVSGQWSVRREESGRLPVIGGR